MRAVNPRQATTHLLAGKFLLFIDPQCDELMMLCTVYGARPNQTNRLKEQLSFFDRRHLKCHSYPFSVGFDFAARLPFYLYSSVACAFSELYGFILDQRNIPFRCIHSLHLWVVGRWFRLFSLVLHHLPCYQRPPPPSFSSIIRSRISAASCIAINRHWASIQRLEYALKHTNTQQQQQKFSKNVGELQTMKRCTIHIVVVVVVDNIVVALALIILTADDFNSSACCFCCCSSLSVSPAC